MKLRCSVQRAGPQADVRWIVNGNPEDRYGAPGEFSPIELIVLRALHRIGQGDAVALVLVSGEHADLLKDAGADAIQARAELLGSQ
jgi:hypothetical protein